MDIIFYATAINLFLLFMNKNIIYQLAVLSISFYTPLKNKTAIYKLSQYFPASNEGNTIRLGRCQTSMVEIFAKYSQWILCKCNLKNA